jgi:hypothetical protein
MAEEVGLDSRETWEKMWLVSVSSVFFLLSFVDR